MTPAQLTALKSEVSVDPTALGFAPLLPSSPGQVCVRLNVIGAAKCLQSRFVTARTVLNECAGGGAILDTLEKASLVVVAAPMTVELQASIKWALKFLAQDSGIDVGNTATQGLIDACVTVGVLSATQGTSLKAMGMLPCSRAQTLGLGIVVESDLRAAGVI